MKAGAAVAATLLSALVALPVGASERVVVLEPRALAGLAWPQGARAVVSELSASSDELVIRASDAETLAALELELGAAAQEPLTVGAVAVVRVGATGMAYVRVRGGSGTIHVEDELGQGVVAEGAIALRVSELLHVRRIELPPEPSRPSEAHPSVSRERVGAFWPWLGVGALGSSDAQAPETALLLGVRFPLTPWLELDASGAVALDALEVKTPSGSAEVKAQELGAHLLVVPLRSSAGAEPALELGLGAGAGLVWLSATAHANAGYVAHDDSTLAALASARAAGSFRSGGLRLVLVLEAGALVPPVSVRSDGADAARLGFPWLLAALGVGYGP